MGANENFDAWFKGSKAVHRDGTPIVLYHGTKVDITAFEGNREATNYFMGRSYKEKRLGIFFAQDPEYANSFALQGERMPEGANVVPVHIATKKVLDLTEGFGGLHRDDFDLLKPFFSDNEWAFNVYPHDMWELFDQGMPGASEFVTAVRAAGFDSVLTNESAPDGSYTPVWIVFEPEQIKSSIGNNGQFRADNADIRFSADGAEPRAPAVAANGSSRLLPVEQMSPGLQAEIRALEAIGASAGHFEVEAAAILNDPVSVGHDSAFDDGSFSGPADAPVFYSALARGIETAMPRDKMGMISPEQAGAWINAKAREGKLFKASEVQWSGVNEFLSSAPAKFLVTDLVEVVEVEGVQLVDIINGGPDAGQQRIAQQDKVEAIAKRLFSAIRSRGSRVVIDGTGYFADEIAYMLLDGNITPLQLPEELRKDAADWLAEDKKLTNFSPTAFSKAQYAEYAVRHGANYRELLITAPDLASRKDPEREAYEQWCREKGNSPSSTSAEEAYARLTGRKAPPPITMTERQHLNDKRFTSRHFRKVQNIVAHVRFDERVGPNGERVLFINELQSDWGQSGKRKGFREPGEPVLPAGYTVTRSDPVGYPNAWITYDEKGEAKGPAFWAMSAAEAATKAAYTLEAAKGTVPVGPFVMKTEQWVSLAVKRMVRYAAENGFDQVAIINGKQAAALYDLRMTVDSIVVVKQANGFHVTGWRGDSAAPEMEKKKLFDKTVSGTSDMTDLIGKDLAERASKVCLVEGDIEIFEGDALTIGGNGMLYFYDSLVPNVINDVLKKVGGEKVSPIKIDVTDYGAGGRTDEKAKYAAYGEQIGFTITPEMRATVMHGLPMFRRPEVQAATPVLAMRRGEIDPAGAYFATYGSSTYFDVDNPAIEKYDISAVGIIDTNVPEQAVALLEETLKDERLNDEERNRLRQEISDVLEYGGGIGYMIADALPLADAGKRLGFDGMKVVENDDLAAGSSVFIWNTALVTKMSEEAFRQQYEVQFGEGSALTGDAFSAWFGQSKVLTPDLEPLVLYHGTGDDTGSVFKPNTFFTPRPDVAAIYASAPTRQVQGQGPNISAVFMRLENPYIFDAVAVNDNLSHHVLGKRGRIDDVCEHLKGQGYDGIILKNYDDLGGPQDQYVAFSSEQLKSAVGNNGNYDPASDDIRFRIEQANPEPFVSWFDGSKVVADDGTPLAVHHQTHFEFPRDQFDRLHGAKYFNRDPEGIDTVGIWFTDSENTKLYGPNNVDVFLAIKNPLVLRDDPEGTAWDQLKAMVDGTGGTTNLRSELMSDYGHDGIKLDRTALDGTVQTVWIAFEPDQIRDVQPYASPFENWFGESKVVGKDGKPVVVYHGTQSDELTAFAYQGEKHGFYFAQHIAYANLFAGEEGGNVIPVYLSIKNPADIRAGISAEIVERLAAVGFDVPDSMLKRPFDDLWNLFDGDDTFMNALISAGYDGCRMFEPAYEGINYPCWIAFYPHQIKSAISNNGDFDPSNDDIRFRREVPEATGFDAWFGQSQAVTAGGDPLIVFHGTGSPDFTVFEKNLLGTSTGGADAKQGFFFAENAASAEQFIWKAGEKTGAIYPVYLSLQNPKIIDGFVLTGANGTAAGRLIADAKLAGHDGVIFAESDMLGHVGRSFVVFEPEQIKGALGNNGDFDPANPDIRFRKEEGKTLGWTDDRLDSLMSAYSYRANPRKTKAYAAMISPEAFLNLTATANALEEIKNETGPLDLDMLQQQAQEMYLRFDGFGDETPRVDGHEGRHRAYALQQAGFTQIPIVLYFGEGKEVGPAESKVLLPQQFHSGRVALSSAQVRNLVPLSGAYVEQLREQFVAEKTVQFRKEERAESSAAEPLPKRAEENFANWFNGSKIVGPEGNPLIVFHGTTADFSVFQSQAPATVYRIGDEEIHRADSWDMGADHSAVPDAYHFEALSSAMQLGADAALRLREADAERLNLSDSDTMRCLRDLRRLAGKSITASTEVRPTKDGFYFTPDIAYSYIRNIGEREGGNVMPLYVSIKNPIYLDASQIERAGAAFNVEKYKAQGYDGAVFSEYPDDLTRRGYMGSVQIVAFDASQIKSAIGNNLDFDPTAADIRFKRPAAAQHLKPSTNAEIDAVQALAQAFNSRLGVLKLTKESTFQFSGVHLNSTIWLNEASQKPFHAVFGHELTHQMQHERPDLYEALVTAVEPLLVNRDGYRAMMGLQGMSEQHLRDEMVADLVGDRFAEKPFWDMVAVRSGSLFKGIASFVADKIDLAKATLTGTARNRTLGSERFVKDLDSARAHIADSVAAYATWKAEIPKNGRSPQQAGFFEAVTKSAGQMVTTKQEGRITPEHQWLANALADDIDGRINAVYKKRTGKEPIYAAVFDWLIVKAFKPNHKENAESDLVQIASERGLTVPPSCFDDAAVTVGVLDRLLAAGAALDQRGTVPENINGPDAAAPF